MMACISRRRVLLGSWHWQQNPAPSPGIRSSGEWFWRAWRCASAERSSGRHPQDGRRGHRSGGSRCTARSSPAPRRPDPPRQPALPRGHLPAAGSRHRPCRLSDRRPAGVHPASRPTAIGGTLGTRQPLCLFGLILWPSTPPPAPVCLLSAQSGRSLGVWGALGPELTGQSERREKVAPAILIGGIYRTDPPSNGSWRAAEGSAGSGRVVWLLPQEDRSEWPVRAGLGACPKAPTGR